MKHTCKSFRCTPELPPSHRHAWRSDGDVSVRFLRLPQKLSIGALSKQFPLRDIEACMPNCSTSFR
jgi:hypothetical protein